MEVGGIDPNATGLSWILARNGASAVAGMRRRSPVIEPPGTGSGVPASRLSRGGATIGTLAPRPGSRNAA